MNAEILDKILSCKALPSLPAVAIKVIEQTSDPNIKLTELALTIQNDQGLAAKVLRTVNSSFYGLRTPCSTINRALVLMGLAPVKTLVLGFSLVNAVNERRASSFDYVAYWRRGLYTAVAAKAIAEAAGKKWGDEAFLAGLLQDIGVVAMLSSLGDDYLRVTLAAADHRLYSKGETETFEVTHAEIGAMLAERWKLPEELVMPVRYHERPTAAPAAHADLCRCVGLANHVHDVLTDQDPSQEMARLKERAQLWFGLDAEALEAVVRRSADGTRELSRLFNLDTGSFANADAILDRAVDRQVALDQPAPVSDGDVLASLVKDSTNYDPLTGVHSRNTFTALVRAAISTPRSPGRAPVLLNVSLESTPALATAGDDVDERTVRLANALTRQFAAPGMSVCRVSPDLFAVVVASATDAEVTAHIQELRRELAKGRPALAVHVGQASFSGGNTSPQELVVAAARSLHAARQAGAKRTTRAA